MKTVLLSKEKIKKLKIEIRYNIVFGCLATLIYIISIVLLAVFMNRTNYQTFSLIIAILTAIFAGVLLYLIRLNILQKHYYIKIINRCLINDLDKRIGVFTKKEKTIFIYHNMYVNKYIFRSNNKDYDIYFAINSNLNIEFEKQYVIEELNTYLVTFEEIKDEKDN